MTLADKIVVLDAVAWRRLGNRWSCTTIRQTVFRRIYRFAKDELPAGKSDRHPIDQVQVELPMPNRQQVWLPLKAVMSRLEPICRWVFARNITAE